MKLQILVVCGGLLCLGAIAPGQTSSQTKSTQSANRVKRPATGAALTVTGCVDQQDGKYVIRDVQTSNLITLAPSGTDPNDDFARFVGHQAQASGTMQSGTLTVTHIGQVADMCPIGK